MCGVGSIVTHRHGLSQGRVSLSIEKNYEADGTCINLGEVILFPQGIPAQDPEKFKFSLGVPVKGSYLIYSIL